MLSAVRKFLPVIPAILLFGCKQELSFYNGPGVKPVYISIEELSDIRSLEPQPTEKTGPILLLNDLFFMVERKKGIHVFDVSNLSNPIKISFIKIPAVNDFSVRNNLLLADNGPNLVSIDFTDIYNIVVVNIENNVFQIALFPPEYTGNFECADLSKGIPIDWEEAELTQSRCRTFN